MIRSILLLGALLPAVVAGCSSPAPEPALYLLRNAPAEGEGPVGGATRIGLGRVLVAPYLLASPGIVLETAPGVVRPGNQHQWAEPLDQALRWFLRVEIGRALGHDVGGGLTDVGGWDYSVDVFVGRLHGTMDGKAVLESAFVIRPREASARVSEYRFGRSQPLADEGYGALVDAERELLTQLAARIADGLRAAMDATSEAPEAEAP